MSGGTISVGFPVFLVQSTVIQQTVHKPTVFERMVLRLCGKYRDVAEIGGLSLREIFEEKLGVQSAPELVGPSVESLVALGLLQTPLAGNAFEIPLTQLSLTQEGRVLLENGRFPSRSKPKKEEHLLFPLSGEIRPRRSRDSYQENPVAPSIDSELLWPANCSDLVRQALVSDPQQSASANTELLSIESVNAGTFWEFHQLALDCDRSGAISISAADAPEVQRWLDSAVPESVWDSILEPVLTTDWRAAESPQLDERTLKGVIGIAPIVSGAPAATATEAIGGAILRVVSSMSDADANDVVPTIVLKDAIVATRTVDSDRTALTIETSRSGGLPLGFASLALGPDRVPTAELRGFCHLYWAGQPHLCLANVSLDVFESTKVWNLLRTSLEDALTRSADPSLASLRGLWESPQAVIEEWGARAKGITLRELVVDATRFEHSLSRFHGSRSAEWRTAWLDTFQDALDLARGGDRSTIPRRECWDLLAQIRDIVPGNQSTDLQALLARAEPIDDLPTLKDLRTKVPLSTPMPRNLIGDPILRTWIDQALAGETLELHGPHTYSTAFEELRDSVQALQQSTGINVTDRSEGSGPRTAPPSAAFASIERWRVAQQNLVDLLPTSLRSDGALSQVEQRMQKWVEHVAGFFGPAVSSDRRLVVFDTNVLMDMPQILDVLHAGDTAVVPKRTNEELDGLKNSSDDVKAHAARLAIRMLDRAKHTIRPGAEAPQLLPPELDRRSPDNRILSVALWLRLSRVILVTSDQDLRVKARAEHIEAISPEEYRDGPSDASAAS